MSIHVALLMGGWSAEREVSLSSGEGVEQALKELGYRVTAIDVQHDIAEVLAKVKPDVAFNALHGRWGEDGCIQGVLEVLEIPYTHSNVLASALAMDKPMAKKVFAMEGIPCAEGRIVSRTEMLQNEPMARPFVVKPLNEGSSVGVQLVFEKDNTFFSAENWSFGEEVLVEEYIAGHEVQVAVIGQGKKTEALGAIEICPKGKFYDYEAKYTEGKAEHLMPAPMHPKAYDNVLEMARRAHVALGCAGVSRADFRYDDRDGEPGKLYLLEVNTQPGMTPLSLVPEIAEHAGMSYTELVDRLVKDALNG